MDMPPEEKQAAYLDAAFTPDFEPWVPPFQQTIRQALLRLLFSAVRWEGVDDVTSRFIERTLLMTGRILAVKSRLDFGKRTPAGVYFGKYNCDSDLFDFYGQPLKVYATGVNGTAIYADYDNYVIGYDTCATSNIGCLALPRFGMIDAMAKRIYDSYAAWQVSRETSKAAMILTVNDDRQEKLVKEALENVSENKPYIIIQNGGAASASLAAPVEVNFRNNIDLVKLHYDNYVNTWGACLDVMGFPNAAPNKHERMIVGEMELDQSLSRYVGGDWMKARELFAEQVKKKLGLSITPVFATEEIGEEARANVPGTDGNAVSDLGGKTGE